MGQRFRKVAPLGAAVALMGNWLAPAQAQTSPVINEVLLSHTGTDDTEYIEFFGSAGFSLLGWSLLVVEGDVGGMGGGAGIIDRRLDFTSADVFGASGFFLVGNPVGLGNNYGISPNRTIDTNFFENSSLTLALVLTSTAGAVGTLVDESATTVFDAVAFNDGSNVDDRFFFGAPVIGPDGPFFPAGAARRRDGVDTNSPNNFVLTDFNLGPINTPGSANPVRGSALQFANPLGGAAIASTARAGADAVPEPGTLALLGIGLLPLAKRLRRRPQA